MSTVVHRRMTLTPQMRDALGLGPGLRGALPLAAAVTRWMRQRYPGVIGRVEVNELSEGVDDFEVLIEGEFPDSADLVPLVAGDLT